MGNKSMHANQLTPSTTLCGEAVEATTAMGVLADAVRTVTEVLGASLHAGKLRVGLETTRDATKDGRLRRRTAEREPGDERVGTETCAEDRQLGPTCEPFKSLRDPPRACSKDIKMT